jgi:hypothetical protein
VEEVVTHLKFNFARDADYDLAGEEEEDAFQAPHAQDEPGVNEQLPLGDAILKVVNGAANEQGNEDSDAILQKHGDAAYGIAAKVLLEVRKQGLELLQHVRV